LGALWPALPGSTNFRKDESATKGFFIGKSMDKHKRYESEKATWLHLHPDATQEQIEAACKAIAKRLGL
jgi:hypothetical protein